MAKHDVKFVSAPNENTRYVEIPATEDTDLVTLERGGEAKALSQEQQDSLRSLERQGFQFETEADKQSSNRKEK